MGSIFVKAHNVPQDFLPGNRHFHQVHSGFFMLFFFLVIIGILVLLQDIYFAKIEAALQYKVYQKG